MRAVQEGQQAYLFILVEHLFNFVQAHGHRAERGEEVAEDGKWDRFVQIDDRKAAVDQDFGGEQTLSGPLESEHGDPELLLAPEGLQHALRALRDTSVQLGRKSEPFDLGGQVPPKIE